MIGTALAARAQWYQNDDEESRKRLFFVFNNPPDVIMPFKRSESVLTHPGITKICLFTGN